MTYRASCHCGTVTLAVEGDIPAEAIECNCSHCRAKGFLLAAVPGESVTIIRGEDQLKTYRFHNKVIDHRFCSNCGAQPFAQGAGKDGTAMAMINLRCVAEADLERLKIQKFDGASR